MTSRINAETAAKIKALERIAPLFAAASPEKKGYLLAYMDITQQLIVQGQCKSQGGAGQ